MGEEKQFGVASKAKPDAADGCNTPARIPAWSKNDFTSNGTLKRDYFKTHSYNPPTTLDSDGTLGSSGNDSDSSEELHYGPGFVSRLKSRYMSVALRGSTGLYGKSPGNRKLTNLRRTASLEDFLEQEKSHDQPPLKDVTAKASNFTKNARSTTTSTGPTAARASAGGVENRASRSKDRTRQDSMKRCQSVEVLSVQDRHPAKPPSNRPPPLPPKSTDRPLEGVLNNSLANEVEVVEESNRAAKQEDKKVVRFKKAVPEGSTTSLRRPYHKRRSSGLLFGVEERELPAPDTVKETRKIFESIDKSAPVRTFGSITKSQSTSSLYQPSNQRHPSVDRNDPLSNLSRKKSDENLSKRIPSPQRRPNYGNYINNKSNLYRNVSPKVNSKPSLPSKPITIQYSLTRKDAATETQNSSVPVLPAKRSSISEENQKNLDNSREHQQASLGDGLKFISNDSLKNIRQSGATFSFSFQSDSGKNQTPTAKKSYLPNLANSISTSGPRQIGVIKPITREGNNINLSKSNVDEELTEKEVIIIDKSERQFEVPNVRKTSSQKGSEKTVRNPWKPPGNYQLKNYESKVSQAPIPVPASRGQRQSSTGSDVGQILTAQPAIINTSDSSEDTEDSSFEPPKDQPREIIVERESPPTRLLWKEQEVEETGLIPPPKSFTSATTENTTSSGFSASPPREFKLPTFNLRKSKQDETTNEEAKVVVPPPPPPRQIFTVPIEDQGAPTNSSPTLSPKVSSPPSSPPLSTTSSIAKAEDAKAKLRQKLNPVPNTVVFNFVGTDKEVNHIENDGLDMSNRRSKKANESGIVILGGIGESTDFAEDSEQEDADHNRPVSPCSVVFVGANVKHGKSSIRSKPRAVKLNIRFSESKPEVFEYPSYDASPTAAQPPSSNASTLRSASHSVGSFGGLGSYTPSKVLGLDNNFQLGVTRTPLASSSTNKGRDDDTPVDTSNELDHSPPANLWPAKDAVSWSGQTSAFTDMLF